MKRYRIGWLFYHEPKWYNNFIVAYIVAWLSNADYVLDSQTGKFYFL